MLTLTFLRHGQTDCSLQNRFCGAIDVPLNEAGRQMAEALGESYAQEPWAAIYASPLLRAGQTVAPLARRLGMTVLIEDGLREIAYGEWEGLPAAEVERLQPEAFAAWSDDPAKLSPPGGETAVQVAARAMAAVQSIRDNHPDGHVLVAAHKATIRIIVCTLLGIDVRLFRKRVAQEVGTATTFQFKDSGPLLLTLNDASMLPPHLRHAGGT